ncbi:MAG: acyl-CoA synthetase [Pseudomonadota bacterium]
MLRIMTWISLRLGRRAGRIVLHGIAAYFLLFASASRRASRMYLARVLRRPPQWTEVYRHFLSFASTIHDRIYLLNQRFDLFDITVHGEQTMLDAMADDRGVFLIGAHMGSFEVIRALGRSHTRLKVAMAMYEQNARKINQMLSAINPNAQQDVISLGHVDSMLKVNQYLDAGTFVGMLADRTINGDVTLPTPLLGAYANMPMGPFRMAAILRRPVVFMTGLYLGGNRYEIHFEPLADFSTTQKHARQGDIRLAMTRYAELIEKHCRRAPYNWFNFFDFWAPAKNGNTEAES